MEKPYIEEKVITTLRKYNPDYGDDRICMCGHPYYRHFDSYEDMYPRGCKYCGCFTFKEENPNEWRKSSIRPTKAGYYETKCIYDSKDHIYERFYNRKTDRWGTRNFPYQPTYWRPIA
jgi:hypothetical protein